MQRELIFILFLIVSSLLHAQEKRKYHLSIGRTYQVKYKPGDFAQSVLYSNQDDVQDLINCIDNKNKVLDAKTQSILTVANFKLNNYKQTAIEYGKLELAAGSMLESEEFSFLNEIEDALEEKVEDLDKEKIYERKKIADNEQKEIDRKIEIRKTNILKSKEKAYFNLISKSSDPNDWKTYLKAYPNGQYRGEINRKLDYVNNPDKYMLQAIKANNFELVKQLVKNGADLREHDPKYTEGKKVTTGHGTTVSPNGVWGQYEKYRKTNETVYTNWLYEAAKAYLSGNNYGDGDVRIVEYLLANKAGLLYKEQEIFFSDQLDPDWDRWGRNFVLAIDIELMRKDNKRTTSRESDLMAALIADSRNFTPTGDDGSFALFVLSDFYKPQYLRAIGNLLTQGSGERKFNWKGKKYSNYFKYVKKNKNLSSNEQVLNLLGYQMMEVKEYKKAEEYFKTNIKKYPESANVYDSMGECYMAMNKNDEAIKMFKKSLANNPAQFIKANSIANLKKLGVEIEE